MTLNSTGITPLLKQSWIASSVLISMLGVGMGLGFTSSLVPSLEAPDSDIKLTMETSSWLIACLPIFSIVGFFTSSVVMDAYGRRIAFCLDILPGITGMLLTCFAPDVSCLIAARSLFGIGAGGTCVISAVVVGEYTSPEYRPMFLNLKTAFLCMGSTVVHILGHYLHWRIVAGIMTIPLIISELMAFTWPESPSWLAGKKMYRKSEEAFFWVHGKTDDSTKEIKELIHAQRDKIADMTVSDNVLGFLKKFTKKNFLKPVIIFVFAGILLESSGRHFFPAFATKIISEITGSTMNSFYLTLAVDIIITASSFFSSYLAKMIKLRTLLFSTGFISVFVLMLACLNMFLLSRGVISEDYSWISMGLFILFFIFVNFGCTPIPLALIGEIFPLEHRAVGSSIAGLTASLLMTIIFKIMPYLLVNWKIYGTFAVLGLCMGISLIVLYFILPETKNRTLQEIDNFFNYGKFKDSGNIVRHEDNDNIEVGVQ